MSNVPIPTEEAIRFLLNGPDGAEIARTNYLETDIAAAADRYFRSEEFAELRRVTRAKPGMRVLEIGAGWGISAYAFAKSGCVVTAVEPCQSALIGTAAMRRLIDATGVGFSIVEGTTDDLSPDASFDAVYVRQVLHHIPNLESFSRRVFDLLSPNGLFLATREPVISQHKDLSDFLASHPVHFLTQDENALLCEEYTRAIERSGLSIIAQWGPNESPINRFPRSSADLRSDLIQRLSPRFTSVGARMLLSIPPLFQRYARKLDYFDHTPGRLYSFLAQKRTL